MKIEEEIKQNKFASEYHKLAVNIIYTGNWVNLLNSQFLKDYNITSQQYNVLRILRGQHPNPATVNLIMERMLDRMSNVSRIVDKLLEKNYVKRTSCKTDRRAVDIAITPEGLDLLKSIDGKPTKMLQQLKNLTESEAQNLNSYLDKIRNTDN